MDEKVSDSPKAILNKSSSFSGSPVSEKIEVKHLYKNKKGDTFVKHYKYERTGFKQPRFQLNQLFKTTNYSQKIEPVRHSSDTDLIPSLGKHFSSFFSPIKSSKQKVFEKSPEKKNKDEPIPMEIDTSKDSNLSFNASKLDNSVQDTPDSKKYNKDLEENKKKYISPDCKKRKIKLIMKPTKPVEIINSITEKPNFSNHIIFRLIKILCFFFIPVTFGLVCMFCSSDSGFIHNIDTKPITNELQEYIYGQNEILDKLEQNLNLIKNNKIFLFIGGVGVGKTYTSQIIEKNFPFKNNIQKIVMTSHLKNHDLEKNIKHNLVKNEYNLIIIDGLTEDDLYFILPIVNGLTSDKKNNFIMIVIFTLHETVADLVPSNNIKLKGKEISKIFNDNNILHSTYLFSNLNADDTKQCIRYAMNQRGMEPDENIVNDVLENINYKYSGCKGIYSKLALFD